MLMKQGNDRLALRPAISVTPNEDDRIDTRYA